MQGVFSGKSSPLTNKVKKTVSVIAILVSAILFNGCSTTKITQNYEHKIKMTKEEAIQTIKQYLSNYKDLAVDEKGISYTHRRRILVSSTIVADNRNAFGRGTVTYSDLYRYDDYPLRLVFADVVMIKRWNYFDYSGTRFELYNNKGENLSRRVFKDGGTYYDDPHIYDYFAFNRVADEFASALLRLCPNAGIDSSPVVSKEGSKIPIDTALSADICNSVQQGDINKVKSMLDANPELINASNDYGTLLCIAAGRGNKEVAELLIDRGANVNEKVIRINGDFTPLYIAAWNGHKNVAELLIAKGAEVNVKTKNGWTPLHIAVWNGHRDVAELLIDKGAQINAQVSSGSSVLYLAAEKGNREIVELLVAKGATVNMKNKGGFTPLYVAAENNHKDAAELLIIKGADLNAKNKIGWAPLHIASEKGHSKVVELLIDKGAQINVKNNSGCTPLYIAAEKGTMEMVELLIDKGADVNAKADNGWTPLRVATERSHWEVANWLRQHSRVE
jgi:ankyrin repeat protein